ncbi:16S rRNA (guanine(966)-N(2))-methyltransferase RsmD [Avibacterium paragallinarum]|uniref:Ribosomal RNA small subunit methyltransferase D n=1 Tax=Avibacterium paragallinarum TaxID=728 RepID=A0AAE5WG18_AVIPA|nr:16S rRNA (guanine(966)-N(2))-methyltransferase RsmD [Avibacterium paragallinarum]MEE3609249.1 16S rRNA (guanine(966)-N(2))-methyltransferase RsmD [Avibacterium paragallinarum]MEE3620733.1 16S rRNA (guanine(966)-N(2))-methyltransferase RsmD [Avibacterium paragallinarum]MEE3668477.1 16S rRNA (guanine(966)-N(2))-methyltransferase RsmD [Avibacterium paragallinarum]MEE3680935.1 16S rRNA (guanine(966)-N(2))-methyltransferase RsmD [Avibacterium paragallinarum]MEE4386505.1 16S rRNA (guanine(966)-N(
MKKNPTQRTSNVSLAKGEVRIIAGLWRGRKLPVLNAEGLRPTGDRVKETLFNWLMPYIVGANCLDCFAGSGSLGLEALSRQANQVIFLELNKQVANQLSKNLQQLKCSPLQGQVINQNSLQYLQQMPPSPQFDLVFLDPPFHFDLAQQAIDALEQYHWLKPEALIYVETEKNKTLTIPAHWQLLKEKTTGQVRYRLYQQSER